MAYRQVVRKGAVLLPLQFLNHPANLFETALQFRAVMEEVLE